jgi:hypothetical protein
VSLTPIQVTEQGTFRYFLKRYIHSEEMQQVGTFEIPATIGMEAGPAYEMPDGREIIIHWRQIFGPQGEFSKGHVAEYESPVASAEDGWMID